MTSAAATSDPAPAATTLSTWNLDPAHSVAEFKVRYLMIANVKGKFSGLSGVLKLDESDYTRSTVEVSIPTPSVKTVDSRLDAHLKDVEFFDVEQFPVITFKSTGIRSTGDHDYAVTGDLTIHGVTKSVTIAAEDVSDPTGDPWGYQRIGLSGSTEISRKDFGLIWNTPLQSGGVLVGDDVTISLDVQFVKA